MSANGSDTAYKRRIPWQTFFNRYIGRCVKIRLYERNIVPDDVADTALNRGISWKKL